MSSLANTTLSFKSFCKVDFSGGDLSSKCGLLPIGQFMDNMGITSFLKEKFSDGSHRLKRHNDADILLQLIYQNLGGYFTDDSADHLAYEPVMTTVLHKNRLASQPTISRFWHRLNDVSLIIANSSLKFMRRQAYLVQRPSGYIIRLKDNAALQAKVQEAVAAYMGNSAGKEDFPPRFGEFRYAAKSWSKERRIVYKIELRKTEGSCELFPTCTFIVTNREDAPEEIIRLYCKRGNMENFIKESKNEFGFSHMCSHDQTTNENRLLVAGLAYNIFNLFRRLCLPKKWQPFRANELRMRMILNFPTTKIKLIT